MVRIQGAIMWKVSILFHDNGHDAKSEIFIPGSVDRGEVVEYASTLYKRIFMSIFGRELNLEDVTHATLRPPTIEWEERPRSKKRK
jgi:hypothetical protein